MLEVKTNDLNTHDLNLATVDLYSDLTFTVANAIPTDIIDKVEAIAPVYQVRTIGYTPKAIIEAQEITADCEIFKYHGSEVATKNDIQGGGSNSKWVELFDHTTENGERYFTFTTLPDGTPLNASEIIYVIECGKVSTTGITYNGYFDLYNEANDRTQMYINAFQHTAEGNICNGHIFASPYTFPISYQALSKATIAVTTQLLLNQGTNVNFRGYTKRIEVRPNHNFASATHIKIIVKQEL